MGFADLATLIIKRNRKLQKDLKSKYFTVKADAKVNSHKIIEHDNNDYIKANFKRKKSISLQLVLIVVITVVALVYLIMKLK
jgi:hypothetical protein